MAGGRTVGIMNISLVARTQKFLSGIKRARRSIRNFAKGFPILNKRVGAFFAALGVGAAIGLAALINKQRKAIDQIGKFSDELGFSTEQLGALRIAAELSGSSIASLRALLQRFNIRLGEAADGIGEGVKGFKKLGLNANRLEKQLPIKALEATARSIFKLKTAAAQGSASFAIFSRQGVQNLNTLRLLADEGIENLIKKFKKLGVIIGRVATKQIENMNDSFLLTQKVIEGIGTQILLELSPIIEELSNRFVDFATQGKGVEAIAGKITKVFIRMARFARGLSLELQELFNGLQTIAAGLLLVTLKFVKLISLPVRLIGNIFGIKSVIEFNARLDDMLTGMESKFLKSFKNIGTFIGDAIFGGDKFETELTERLRKLQIRSQLTAASQLVGQGKDVQKDFGVASLNTLGRLSLLQKSRIGSLPGEGVGTQQEQALRDSRLQIMTDTLREIRTAIDNRNQATRDAKNNKNATSTNSRDGR